MTLRMRSRLPALGLLGLALLGAGPCGPFPGGRLSGSEVALPGDWSFVGSGSACAVEVRPAEPHSVRATCFANEGTLYVGALFAPRKRWPTFVAADADVRVQIGDDVYPLRAVRIEDAAERARVLGPEPSDSHWLYRLEPRAVAAE